MIEISHYILNNGERVILDRDCAEDEPMVRVTVSPLVKFKKGQGYEVECNKRDIIAKRICDLLNDMRNKEEI